MSKNTKIAIGAATVVALLIVAVAVGRGRANDTAAATGATDTSLSIVAPATSVPAGPDTSTAPTSGVPSSDPSTAPTDPAAPPTTDPGPTTPTTRPAPKPLPVQVSVSGTSGLRNGQAVKIHVVPVGGSRAFAFEAYQCKADAEYRNDADIRPLQSGKCTPTALAAGADQRVEVIGQEPFQSLDGEFKVGVGTKTFGTISNGPSTITCGPGNPCALVLKLQYPDGFGFQSIPISFG